MGRRRPPRSATTFADQTVSRSTAHTRAGTLTIDEFHLPPGNDVVVTGGIYAIEIGQNSNALQINNMTMLGGRGTGMLGRNYHGERQGYRVQGPLPGFRRDVCIQLRSSGLTAKQYRTAL